MSQELQKIEKSFDPIKNIKITNYDEFGEALYIANKIEKLAKRCKDIVKKQGSNLMDQNNDNKIDFPDYYITKGDVVEMTYYDPKVVYEIFFPILGDAVWTLLQVKNTKFKELLPSYIQYDAITPEQSERITSTIRINRRKGSLQLREKLEKNKLLI